MKKTILFFAILLLHSFLFSQEILSPEKLWDLKMMGAVKISPDNKTLIYSVRSTDLDKNASSSKIYSQSIPGSDAVLLDFLPEKTSDFFFLKDGNLAVIANNQLLSFNLKNGESIVLKELPENIQGVKFSQDLVRIAFNKSVKVRKSTHDIHQDLPKSEAMIYDDLLYRHWDTYQNENANQLFVADFSEDIESAAKNLLEGTAYECPHPPFGGAEDYTFSPDGKYLVYVSKKLIGKDAATSTNTDLYLVNLSNFETENITEENKGYDLNPSFSPDGKYLAWLQMKRDGYESDKNDLIVMNIATKEKTNISSNWDGTLNSFTWSNDSKKVFAIVPINGTQQVFTFDFSKGIKSQQPKQLTEGIHNFTSVQDAGKVLIATQTKMHQPTEIFSINPKKGDYEQLSNINTKALVQLNFGKVESELIPSSDGKEIFTWVIYPPNFDPNKKYPTLLYCQGGPQSQVSQFFSTRWNFHMMAAAGYIVVAPNRRGLPGFGVEWNEAISKDWGGQPMRDYLSAIDFMAKKPFVDEENLGAVGASYGGYSVYYLAGIHEGRFKAFISHCGLFNLESWYGTTEELFFANWDIGGSYWDNPVPESFKKFSPHLNAHKWDTPMLIIHGGKDFRVPESEGMQAFQVLQTKGIPSRFLYFPNENHWVLKPQNSILWHREFNGWLDKYLK